MQQTMQTYLLHGPEDIRLTEKPKPDLRPDEVLIRTCFTGICGSDVHYYRDGSCGRFVLKRPFALGHEFSGVVSQTGGDVDELKVGDEVAIDPCMPCGQCRYCRSGKINLCSNIRVVGSASCDPHLDGGLGQFVAVQARNCFVLPHGIDLSQASLLEPLCVALHAVRRVDEIAGRSVLVTGGGPIGQLVLRVVQAFGALRTCVSDIDPFARQFAIESGASNVLDPAGMETVAASDGYDVVFEMAIAMVAAGAIRLDGIISEVYRFDQVPEAMQRAMKKENMVKLLLGQPKNSHHLYHN